VKRISPVPEGLRDVVGKRLSSLSSTANQILRTASVIGREFHLDVLRQVLGCSEEELEAAFEESSAAGIIEERSVVGTTITYRFSHAFFQRRCTTRSWPRRIGLHQQAARVLDEVHVRPLDEHAAELAERYAFSSDAADLAKSVHYAQLAARLASDVFAHGEAACSSRTHVGIKVRRPVHPVRPPSPVGELHVYACCRLCQTNRALNVAVEL
jgi:predicted ATPase